MRSEDHITQVHQHAESTASAETIVEENAARTRLLILFFSGTGNTQFVAEYLRDRVLESCPGVPVDVTLAALEWMLPEEVIHHDLVCIGFPVYEGRAPRNVRDYIGRFPNVTNKAAFVFSTKGLAQGRANRSIVCMVEEKGFRPLGSASLVMPASDGISMLMKKDSKKFQEFLGREFEHLPEADTLATKIRHAIRHLVSGEPVNVLERDAAVTPFGFLLTGIFRLLYSAFGESAAKKLRTTEQCTVCGQCVRTCPMQNISIDYGQVVFGSDCVFCLRCVNNCPQEAVQVGRLSVGKARWHGPRGEYRPLRYRTPKVFSPASQ